MIKWAAIFAIIALIAGALGFTGAAGAAMGIAKLLVSGSALPLPSFF